MNPKTLERVIEWRKKAIREVKAIKGAKTRGELARDYYEIDQMSMNTGEWHYSWPEMEKYLVKGESTKRLRDRLLKARSVCQEVTLYEKSWQPTLEEFRKVHPFDPEDDLTKPFKNKDKKC